MLFPAEFICFYWTTHSFHGLTSQIYQGLSINQKYQEFLTIAKFAKGLLCSFDLDQNYRIEELVHRDDLNNPKVLPSKNSNSR